MAAATKNALKVTAKIFAETASATLTREKLAAVAGMTANVLIMRSATGENARPTAVMAGVIQMRTAGNAAGIALALATQSANIQALAIPTAATENATQMRTARRVMTAVATKTRIATQALQKPMKEAA